MGGFCQQICRHLFSLILDANFNLIGSFRVKYRLRGGGGFWRDFSYSSGVVHPPYPPELNTNSHTQIPCHKSDERMCFSKTVRGGCKLFFRHLPIWTAILIRVISNSVWSLYAIYRAWVVCLTLYKKGLAATSFCSVAILKMSEGSKMSKCRGSVYMFKIIIFQINIRCYKFLTLVAASYFCNIYCMFFKDKDTVYTFEVVQCNQRQQHTM